MTAEALLADARAEGCAPRRREAAPEAAKRRHPSLRRDRGPVRQTAGTDRSGGTRSIRRPPTGSTSAAHDGPLREGVTTITIVTGLNAHAELPMGRREISQAEHRMELLVPVRTVAIDGLRDLMRHLKTATAFEYTILGEPIEDTPQQAKRRLGAKSNGDRNTIREVPRPYLVCDCDSLPNLGEVDVTKLTPEQIHRFAVANLPKEFQKADCAMFYSGSHGTSPGKVKVHLVVLAFEADRHQAPQALARGDQHPRRTRAGGRQPRRRSGRREPLAADLLRRAGVPRRARSGSGAMAFHRRHDAGRAGAGPRGA